MRILCAGAGSAGLGVCGQLADGMIRAGLTRSDALSRFVVCTVEGALGAADGVHGDPHYKHYANGKNEEHKAWANQTISDGSSLLEVVKQFKPTVLLGLSASSKIFTEELIRTMGSYCEHPIIMPMSNPTSKCECSAEEAYRWTDGRAVVASGSPFPPYTQPNGKVLIPSQCNNMYIFPGLGLGAQLAGVSKITDGMLYAAAVACTDSMTPEEMAEGRTFPCLKRIRLVSHKVACAVIEQAMEDGLATKITPREIKQDGSLAAYVSRKMYFPSYVPLVHRNEN